MRLGGIFEEKVVPLWQVLFIMSVDNQMEMPHDESEFLVHRRVDEAGDKALTIMCINVSTEFCVRVSSAQGHAAA